MRRSLSPPDVASDFGSSFVDLGDLKAWPLLRIRCSGGERSQRSSGSRDTIAPAGAGRGRARAIQTRVRSAKAPNVTREARMLAGVRIRRLFRIVTILYDQRVLTSKKVAALSTVIDRRYKSQLAAANLRPDLH